MEGPNSDPGHEGSEGALDEFDLIERLRVRFEAAAGAGPAPGETWIGDDAAVVLLGEEPVVLTTDLVVEGVHFDPALGDPEDVGYKSLMVSLSDLAAMGARPRYAVVSMAAPPGAASKRSDRGSAKPPRRPTVASSVETSRRRRCSWSRSRPSAPSRVAPTLRPCSARVRSRATPSS